MAQETIVLDEESSAILEKLLAESHYPDRERAVLQALVMLRAHHDEYEERLDHLRWEIERGFASGIVEGDPFERLRARHGLPSRVAQ